jgi:pimeloyl-ACP methyl ester carboxylesterase
MPTKKHPSAEKPPVVFVPGGIMPSELAYGPLNSLIGDQIQPVLKELEVYATQTPPPDYGLELEVEGIRHAADSAGFDHFHLVGYSAGGASSLAFTAKYPERLKSLALIEPAWIGSLNSDEDVADWENLGGLMSFPPDDRMRAFAHWQMRPGIEPPTLSLPPGPPPAWMQKRPAGLTAFWGAFNAYSLNQNRFRQFIQPVYYALGSLSTRYYERAAKTLSGFFPDMQIEEYKGRSHFDPPHRAEPERFARALLALWARAQTGILVVK